MDGYDDLSLLADAKDFCRLRVVDVLDDLYLAEVVAGT